MTIYDLLILQIIAHLLADFTFQSKEWVIEKRKDGFRSKPLYWHVLVVFMFSFLLADDFNFILYSLIIAASHLVIDGLKNSLKESKYTFFVDQALHFGIIILMVFLYNHYFLFTPITVLPINTHQLLIIAGYLICTKPANILIKKVLDFYNISFPTDHANELLNAGKLIGIIERLLTLTLLLYNHFEAVGFLITAKSILRYENAKSSKTEYVLIGTMLSFGIAILAFVVINQLIFLKQLLERIKL
jgi:hypothetical protein